MIYTKELLKEFDFKLEVIYNNMRVCMHELDDNELEKVADILNKEDIKLDELYKILVDLDDNGTNLNFRSYLKSILIEECYTVILNGVETEISELTPVQYDRFLDIFMEDDEIMLLNLDNYIFDLNKGTAEYK